MIFAVIVLISAPGLLYFAYSSLKPHERRVAQTRVLLGVMGVAAVSAVFASLIYLIATPGGAGKVVVGAVGSLSMVILVAPFLIASLVNRNR